MSVKLFRHKPTEVFAVTFDDLKGAIDLEGFPIKLTITPTDKCTTDGLYGPLPLFRISGGMVSDELVSHNTVFIARKFSNSDGYYLDFMDVDTFFNRYEPVEKALDKLSKV
jgi:hypothetical protein